MTTHAFICHFRIVMHSSYSRQPYRQFCPARLSAYMCAAWIKLIHSSYVKKYRGRYNTAILLESCNKYSNTISEAILSSYTHTSKSDSKEICIMYNRDC